MINTKQLSALYKLYPQVTNTIGDTAYDADGNLVQYDLTAIEAKAAEMQEAEMIAWQDKDTAKQNAIAKLAKLGLTEAEISALIGA